MLTYRGTPIPRWVIALTLAVPVALAALLILLDL